LEGTKFDLEEMEKLREMPLVAQSAAIFVPKPPIRGISYKTPPKPKTPRKAKAPKKVI
jgi:hypothetical protein